MKTMVISGGSSGIGAATVQRFLAEDYFIFNLDLNDSSNSHERLKFIHCDIASVNQIKSAFAMIAQAQQSIDALVCNAGIHFSANVLETSEADFDRLMSINVKSCFFLTQCALPLLLKQKSS